MRTGRWLLGFGPLEVAAGSISIIGMVPGVFFRGERVIASCDVEAVRHLEITGLFVNGERQEVVVEGTRATPTRAAPCPLRHFAGVTELIKLEFGVDLPPGECLDKAAERRLTAAQNARLDLMLSNHIICETADPAAQIMFELRNPHRDRVLKFSASIIGKALLNVNRTNGDSMSLEHAEALLKQAGG